MDTSETYIKMCEKAEEIHSLDPCKLKVYEAGNWYFLKEEKRVTTQEYEDSFFDYVWLPRQDQLQEMLQPCGYQKLLTGFPKFAYSFDPYHSGIPWCASLLSMEQLWLAFVMKEKYNKVWNGSEWIVH